VILATGSRSRKVWNPEIDPRATLVVHDSRSGFEVCGGGDGLPGLPRWAYQVPARDPQET